MTTKRTFEIKQEKLSLVFPNYKSHPKKPLTNSLEEYAITCYQNNDLICLAYSPEYYSYLTLRENLPKSNPNIKLATLEQFRTIDFLKKPLLRPAIASIIQVSCFPEETTTPSLQSIIAEYTQATEDFGLTLSETLELNLLKEYSTKITTPTTPTKNSQQNGDNQ